MQVRKKSTITDTENRREIKIKTRKNTAHGGGRKHNMKVANNVKRVVKNHVKT